MATALATAVNGATGIVARAIGGTVVVLAPAGTVTLSAGAGTVGAAHAADKIALSGTPNAGDEWRIELTGGVSASATGTLSEIAAELRAELDGASYLAFLEGTDLFVTRATGTDAYTVTRTIAPAAATALERRRGHARGHLQRPDQHRRHLDRDRGRHAVRDRRGHERRRSRDADRRPPPAASRAARPSSSRARRPSR